MSGTDISISVGIDPSEAKAGRDQIVRWNDDIAASYDRILAASKAAGSQYAGAGMAETAQRVARIKEAAESAAQSQSRLNAITAEAVSWHEKQAKAAAEVAARTGALKPVWDRAAQAGSQTATSVKELNSALLNHDTQASVASTASSALASSTANLGGSMRNIRLGTAQEAVNHAVSTYITDGERSVLMAQAQAAAATMDAAQGAAYLARRQAEISLMGQAIPKAEREQALRAASVQSRAAWNASTNTTIRNLEAETQAQQNLNAAIGRGYEARAKAEQENAVATANRYLGGTVPFGWTLDEEGELVADKSQQAAIARMVALREAGQSLRAIADTMKAEGVNLSHAGVKKIIEAAKAHMVTPRA